MTIKEKIAKMIEQYSIAKDNPTVLRELFKLSAIVELLIDEVDDLEDKVNTLDPDEIKKLLADMQTEVDAANEAAQKAITDVTSAEIHIGIIDNKIAEIETNIQNIQNSITTIEASLETKQNKLTFDDTPTEGSQNPVTSDGIYKAVNDIIITLDDEVTENSQNGVKSSGIYTAIETAKTELQRQITVTSTSVSAQALQIVNLQHGLEVTSTSVSAHALQIADLKTQQNTQQGDIEEALADIAALEADKQNKLTFDEAPTENSENPVTSGGVFTSIETAKTELNTSISAVDSKAEAAQSTADGKMDKMTVDTTVTENSENLVTSGAVFSAVGTVADELAGKQDALFADQLPVSSNLITDLSTAPVDGTMATALAIYNAIANAPKGFTSATYEQKTVHVTGDIDDMWIDIPENFVPIYYVCNMSWERQNVSYDINFYKGLGGKYTDGNNSNVIGPIMLLDNNDTPRMFMADYDSDVNYQDGRVYISFPNVVYEIKVSSNAFTKTAIYYSGETESYKSGFFYVYGIQFS